MKTILAPIDFSPVTARVVAEAASLARVFDGRVVLMHVSRPASVVAEYGPFLEGLGTDLAVWNDAMEKAARRHLERIEDGLECGFIRAESIQLTGDPVLLIIEQAQKLPADYIVIGSHGHTALHDLVLGSTASGVLKRAACPVIVVPPVRQRKKIKWTRATRRTTQGNAAAVAT